MIQKNTILYLLISCITLIQTSIAQNTAIPDNDFEQGLIDLGLDTVLDGQVLTANINTVTLLNINDKPIADLTGIEAFDALENLYAGNTNIVNLDLSSNTNLDFLSIAMNTNSYQSINVSNTLVSQMVLSTPNLSSINVTNTVNLSSLDVSNTNLSTLDVSSSFNLSSLNVTNTNLSTLDVSSNSNLWYLNVSSNSNLSTLDVSSNSNLSYLDVSNNSNLLELNLQNGNNTNLSNGNFSSIVTPNLSCIQVDDVAYSDTTWNNIDTANSFNTDCGFTLGIDENTFDVDFSIYPNPVSDILNISTSTNINSLKIYDLNGKFLVASKNTSIDTSLLSSGIYILQIETGKGTEQRKIIKK